MIWKFRGLQRLVLLSLLLPPWLVAATTAFLIVDKSEDVGCSEFEQLTFFTDDFEDAQTDGWSFSDSAGEPLVSPWPVENDGGNLVLSGSGHQWATIGDRPWSDYTLRLRVKLITGSVHLNYRLGEGGRYFLSFHEGGLDLNRETTNLASDAQPHQFNAWYTVEITGVAGHIQVFVDDILRLDVIDPNPLLGGSIGLETLPDSLVHFDDISVVGNNCTELRWSQTGKLPGGGIVSLEVAPSEPDVVFFTTNVNDLGMWRSDDAGRTWKRVFQHTHGHGVAIHPDNSEVALLLGGHGTIFKTSNGAVSWHKVFEDESNDITDLAFAPNEPNIIYASTWSEENINSSEILKSSDGGENWNVIAAGLDLVAVLYVSPANPNVIYAGTVDGVRQSTDGGLTWVEMGLKGMIVISLSGHGSNPQILYAASNSGLYKTTNGGQDWSLIAMHAQDVHRVAVALSDSQVIYAGGHNGVVRSSDGGLTWKTVNGGLDYLDVGGLAVSPDNANTVYLGTGWWRWIAYHGHDYDQPLFGEGIYKTTNGGHHWDKLNGEFEDRDALAVLVDPNNAGTVYAGTTCSRGGFRSTDGGLTWGLLNSGASDNNDLHHYSMSMAVGTEGNKPLYWTGRFGIAKSLDKGMTWENLSKRRHFHGLAVDPTDSEVIYLGTAPISDSGEELWMEGAHLFKSMDGGTSWNEMDSGFPHGTMTAVHSIVINPANPQILYAATTSHEAEVAYGIYKSLDAGENWAAVNNGLTNTDVLSLAIDPANPSILYAGTIDGVFKTVNGGNNWTGLGLTGLVVEALVIDPAAGSNSVYAGTSGGAFKTRDGGATWYAVNWGLPGRVAGLSIDPPGNLIYAAVPGGGVFRAPLNQVAGLSLSSGPRLAGLPGETITHTFEIRNTGNGVDSFDLEVTSARGWPVAVIGATSIGSIGFNHTEVIQIAATIPSGVAMGTIDSLTLTATSHFDRSESASAQGETWVAREIHLPIITRPSTPSATALDPSR